MSNHDIKLPPLPYPYDTPAYRTVGAVIQEYTRAAIKADRQRRCEPMSKTYWNNELSSWSDEDFIRIFHERPDLAKRLRKMLSEPVKVPSDNDSLTIAYISGYHDGKRSTTPEGWQLVPKEPTDEMKKAGCQVPLNKAARHNACYKAMLAAAPKFGEEE